MQYTGPPFFLTGNMPSTIQDCQSFASFKRAMGNGKSIKTVLGIRDGMLEVRSEEVDTLATMQSSLRIDPAYGDLDNDTLMVLSKFNLPAGSSVLEIGANEEPTACILSDNGFHVTAVDLRPHRDPNLPANYLRLEGDFVRLAPALRAESFDSCISTSALEHFGLGTYGKHDPVIDHDYDMRAVAEAKRLLKPGGLFYVTVPYGRQFTVNAPHWRVYDRDALQSRLAQDFKVVEKVFFKSADCSALPDDGGYPVPLVREEDANQFDPGDRPHLTCFLLLRKGGGQ